VTGDAVAVGDHVDVTEFVRRGDEKDIEVFDGWVAELTEWTIVLSQSPDFATEPDPWLTLFPLTGRGAVVVTLNKTKPRVTA
jgi:hypothetical protein